METGTLSAFDLRRWLAEVGEAEELIRVRGADPNLEIGAASQINYRRDHPKALLFEDIAGHLGGRRVLTGSVANPGLLGRTLGLGGRLDDQELVAALGPKPSEWVAGAAHCPALPVDDGPLLSHTVSKRDVNFSAFPCPVWHEADGGPYVGTGCAVVTVDPDSGVPNLGAYRIQVQDGGRAVTVNIEAGKHGSQHVRRWFAKEGRAPIAASLGHHPVFLVVAGTEVPADVSEFDYAGAILGEPVPVVHLPETGLPVPAESELAFEGWLYPDRTRPEGPFGEWTGYYSGGTAEVLCVDVAALYHRDDPILLGAPPGKPPHDYSYMRSVMKSAMAMQGLVATGLPGVVAVWCHEAGGGRAFIAVALQQRYPGHSRQAGYLAAQHPVTAYMNRLVVTVDPDIDPRDLDQVLWAIVTRCDPEIDVELMRKTWGSRVDPLVQPGQPTYNSRLLIDACRPFERLDSFPVVASSDSELLERVARRWPELVR